MIISRTHPPLTPRPGLGGLLDRFAGPGATAAELWLQFLPPLGAAIAAPAYALTLPTPPSPLQLSLLALLAFDAVGGVLTNATAAAKRWYHRPGQTWWQHWGFVALHVGHLVLIAWVWRGGDWGYVSLVGGYLLVAALVILQSPLYLQPPLALGLYGLALVGDRYLLTPTPGLEWFLPLLFLKLLVSHLLQASPTAPTP